ncbi:hypothetical protein [Moorena producens]|nr:hypothetical protein [Moorena producens]
MLSLFPLLSSLLRSRSVANGLSPCSVRVAWPTASVPKNPELCT